MKYLKKLKICQFTDTLRNSGTDNGHFSIGGDIRIELVRFVRMLYKLEETEEASASRCSR